MDATEVRVRRPVEGRAGRDRFVSGKARLNTMKGPGDLRSGWSPAVLRRDPARLDARPHPVATGGLVDLLLHAPLGVQILADAGLADAGYTGRLLVWSRTVLRLSVQIVRRTESGFVVLPRRWVAERTFAWLSKHRRCVRDYETKPEHYEAMIHIAMIMTMSRRFARTGDW